MAGDNFLFLSPLSSASAMFSLWFPHRRWAGLQQRLLLHEWSARGLSSGAGPCVASHATRCATRCRPHTFKLPYPIAVRAPLNSQQPDLRFTNLLCTRCQARPSGSSLSFRVGRPAFLFTVILDTFMRRADHNYRLTQKNKRCPGLDRDPGFPSPEGQKAPRRPPCTGLRTRTASPFPGTFPGTLPG